MKKLALPTILWFGLLCTANVPVTRAQGCSFENNAYFEGQVVCQYGSQMKCVDGAWTQTGDACDQEDDSEDVEQPEVDGPAEVQMPSEPQVPEVPDIPPASE